MTNRVGNADLYIGMVRRRKSLPRDSKGFEPIENYLKEVEEELNQDSSVSESGEETDIEEEKRKEERAWELKRRERERERRAREEAREREMQQRVVETRREEERETNKEVQKKRGKRSKRQSVREGSRRSLRQRGIVSDTDDRESSHSASEAAEPPVVGPVVAPVEGHVGGGGGSDREKKKVGTTRRGRQSRKSAPASSNIKTVSSARVGEEEEGGVPVTISSGDSGDERGGEEGNVGRSQVNGYSPEVSDSPTRDTIKLGPVRLTFSASPSDDEHRRRDAATVKTRRKRSRGTVTLPPTDSNTAMTAAQGDSESESGNTAISGEETLARESSHHDRAVKTDAQAKRGKLARASTAKKSVRRHVVRRLESGSEEDEEVDPELMSLLEPARLVGLSHMTNRAGEKSGTTHGHGHGGPLSGRSTDEELEPANRAAEKGHVNKSKRRKSAIRVTIGKKKSSRKSVVFNPHTTNLGSPDLPPVPPRTVSSAEDSDTGGNSSGGVYDHVPSDEEDFTHSKSRLYSPRRKTSLRKAALQKKNKSVRRGAESREDTTGSQREEMKQEVVKGPSMRELSVRVEDISSRGQWFVPEELNIHKMISANSPRSLRRLTQSIGRTSTVSNVSSVVAPPRQRQKQPKPRELDSTVDTGGRGEESGGERMSNQGSLNTGATSAEQNLPPASSNVTSVSSDVNSVSNNVTSVSGDVNSVSSDREKKKSKQRASRSAKLTPPWRLNKPRTTPHTVEGREEHTPVSKKTKVSTPEEDEGMASGGGMSLSSSDEEDPPDLVRSMGGRRYRRYVVEHQTSKTPGVRRSQRSRMAPVQHWQNEIPEYERRRSGVTLKGVLVPVEQTDRKQTRRRKVPATAVSVDDNSARLFTVTDKHGVEKTLNIVTHPSLCERINGQGELASKADDFVITRLSSSPSTSCGLIELRYLGEKERSSTNTHEVFFFVLKGTAQFLVGRKTFNLSVESQIRIPAGVTYAVKNMHRSLLRLYYYSHQIQ